MKLINDIFDIDYEYYKNLYSETGLLSTLLKYARKLAKDAVLNALKIYYAIKLGKIDAANLIFAQAGLGYLISPIDLLPDFLPLGITDDISVLCIVIALLTKKGFIDSEVIKKAKETLSKNKFFSS